MLFLRCESGEIELLRLVVLRSWHGMSSIESVCGRVRPPANDEVPGRGDAVGKGMRCVAPGAMVAPRGWCMVGMDCCCDVAQGAAGEAKPK